jgi:hypothetical protein
VLDEINRAEVDKAFGELFTLLSGQDVDLPYRIGEVPLRILAARQGAWDGQAGPGDYVCHPSWRILGSMNVYDRSLLYAMSLAFMRRFAFVDVEVPGIGPDGGPYATLIETWTDRPAARDCLRRMLCTSALTAHRAVGPAIVHDMLRFVDKLGPLDGVYAAAPGDEVQVESALCEAFLVYVAPQLEGLADAGLAGVLEALPEMFPKAVPAIREAVARRIRLLGAHL